MTATETASVSALILEVSSASIRMLPAMMPLLSLSPWIYDWTSVAMRFSAAAPAPLREAPARLTVAATAPAKTVASIDWSDVASTVNAPVALMLESRTKARTSAACGSILIRVHCTRSE